MRVQSVIVHLFFFTPVRLCEEISYAVVLLKIKYLIMLLNVSFHVMEYKYNMMSLIKQQCLYILKLKNIQNIGFYHMAIKGFIFRKGFAL